jgi:iron complex outermembrane receptor protein
VIVRKFIIIFICLFSAAVFGQEGSQEAQATEEITQTETPEDIIYLEAIDVMEKKETTEYITQEQIQLHGTDNLWEIMGTIPGVTLTGGSQRNESNFRLRGFDAARVPVYIDGVSQAVPYRGDADHGRILTYDLESIEVQKGYSSMLMGANNLGGAVNLTIAKPKDALEGFARYNTEFDSIGKHQRNLYAVSAGSRQESFYAKITAAYIKQSHFRLSDDFTPENDYQPDNVRRDSSSEDMKLTLITGFTPTEEIDAYITYILQRAEKKAPGDAAAPDPRIWDWPKWNRDTVSLHASYTADRYYAKLLTYYDKYDNRLFTERPHGVPSDYDDFAIGVKLTGGYDFNSRNNLQASAMWKTDNHRGKDNITGSLQKEVDIEEFTWSLGTEYAVKPYEPVTLVFGLGYDILTPHSYWTVYKGKEHFKNGDTLSALVYQIGLFFDANDHNELHLTYARKAHFPTMTERFSTRFDTVLPNPDLKAEYANHYEFGYKGFLYEKANITANIYVTDFTDKIYTERVRDPATGVTVNHSVNKDEWRYFGFELGSEIYLNDYFTFAGAFSYNESLCVYEEVKDIYYPKLTANLYVKYTPTEYISIIPRMEYTGDRYTSTDAYNRSELDAYQLFHITARIEKIYDRYFIEAGVNNIFDKNYEVRENFPMAGRVYSLTVGAEI